MRRYTRALLVVSCATLLILQMVGLHLHANADAGGASLHAAHVHGADPDGHDHSNDRDVSVVELGTIWAKLPPMLAVLSLLLITPLLVTWLLRFGAFPDVVPRPACRWRPPLRAPPLVS